MKLKVLYVNPKKCEVDKFNVRDTHISDPQLEDSIKTQGIIEPLVVRKVKDKKKYQVVCGGRRLTASRAIRAKQIPVLVRELSDMEALGVSLQENRERDNLTSFEEAESIAKMWEMMNGGKTNQQKYQEINNKFGIGEKRTRDYLSISRLSDSVKKFAKEGKHASISDTDVLKDISREEKWNDAEKKRAIKIATTTDGLERRRLVKELRSKAKEGKSVTEAFEEIKKRPEGKTYQFYMPYQVKVKFEKWCLKNKKDYQTAIVIAVKKLVKMK